MGNGIGKKFPMKDPGRKAAPPSNRENSKYLDTVRAYISSGPTEHTGTMFNYQAFSNMLSDLELNIFFNQNQIPFVSTYPSAESIKSGFITMNENLYRKAKAKEERRMQDPSYRPKKLEKLYLRAFMDKKKIVGRLKEKIDRNVRMYTHSLAIFRLFRCWFSLVDYHHRVLHTYPEIENVFTSCIFMIFGSLKESQVMELLKDVCTTTKMHDFYKDFYIMWKEATDEVEKKMFLTSIL